MKSDESGQLSLDFLVGFTIFLIGFIFVITMASGLLVGLQSRSIDYDAVAYRTGVILVEDPGYGLDPASSNYTTSWEFIPSVDKEDIYRLGLAATKNAPNILSDEKVHQFFDGTKFTSADLHSKVIFDTTESGLYTSQGLYRYHISLISIDNLVYNKQTGDSVPLNSNVGYVRRVVKVKQPVNIPINGSNYTTPATGNFNVYFDFPSLYSMPQPYRIDPLKGKTAINITNIVNPNLTGLSFNYDNPPLFNETGDTPISTLTIPNGPYYTTTVDTDYVLLNLDPGFFTSQDVDPGRQYYFNFTITGPPIGGNYTANNSLAPSFVPAVLEVKIW